MRISDWSSDVCSSDLGQRLLERRRVDDLLALEVLGGEGRDRDRHVLKALRRPLRGDDDILDTARILLSARVGGRVLRCGGIGMGSDEGGVGKERVRTGRARWWPDD